jgi:hypothetical protein
MHRIPLLLILCLAFFAACRTQSAPAGPGRSEIAQWSGQQGGGETPKTRVLRTAEQWDGFWQQVEGDRPRPLDVSREMAVVIELGLKHTGGYSAEILAVRVQNDQLVVEYRERSPEPGEMVTQALTSPWVIAVVPRTDQPVIFLPANARQPSRQDK